MPKEIPLKLKRAHEATHGFWSDRAVHRSKPYALAMYVPFYAIFFPFALAEQYGIEC